MFAFVCVRHITSFYLVRDSIWFDHHAYWPDTLIPILSMCLVSRLKITLITFFLNIHYFNTFKIKINEIEWCVGRRVGNQKHIFNVTQYE